MKIAGKIKTWIWKNRNRGMNQSELARQLDVTQGTVYQWVSNRTYPSRENIVKLVEITSNKKWIGKLNLKDLM